MSTRIKEIASELKYLSKELKELADGDIAKLIRSTRPGAVNGTAIINALLTRTSDYKELDIWIDILKQRSHELRTTDWDDDQ